MTGHHGTSARPLSIEPDKKGVAMLLEGYRKADAAKKNVKTALDPE